MEEDVRGLDVSVDDLAFMTVLDRQEHLGKPVQDNSLLDVLPLSLVISYFFA